MPPSGLTRSSAFAAGSETKTLPSAASSRSFQPRSPGGASTVRCQAPVSRSKASRALFLRSADLQVAGLRDPRRDDPEAAMPGVDRQPQRREQTVGAARHEVGDLAVLRSPDDLPLHHAREEERAALRIVRDALDEIALRQLEGRRRGRDRALQRVESRQRRLESGVGKERGEVGVLAWIAERCRRRPAGGRPRRRPERPRRGDAPPRGDRAVASDRAAARPRARCRRETARSPCDPSPPGRRRTPASRRRDPARACGGAAPWCDGGAGAGEAVAARHGPPSAAPTSEPAWACRPAVAVSAERPRAAARKPGERAHADAYGTGGERFPCRHSSRGSGRLMPPPGAAAEGAARTSVRRDGWRARPRRPRPRASSPSAGSPRSPPASTRWCSSRSREASGSRAAKAISSASRSAWRRAESSTSETLKSRRRRPSAPRIERANDGRDGESCRRSARPDARRDRARRRRAARSRRRGARRRRRCRRQLGRASRRSR